MMPIKGIRWNKERECGMDAEDAPRPVKILLVEDSPTDALLAQEALRSASVA
jgi:hypothetical protein